MYMEEIAIPHTLIALSEIAIFHTLIALSDTLIALSDTLIGFDNFLEVVKSVIKARVIKTRRCAQNAGVCAPSGN